MRYKTTIYLLVMWAFLAAACNLPFVGQDLEPEDASVSSQPETGQAESTVEADQVERTQESDHPDTPDVSDKAPTIDSLIHTTLSLRSIQIEMIVTDPAGRVTSTMAEIDKDGSQHLLIQYPENQTLTSGGQEKPPLPVELFTIVGTVYATDSRNPEKLQITETVMSGKLAQILSGPEGIGLWLKILPEGSLSIGDLQERGGFQAQMYSVHGAVNGQDITGELWIDRDSEGIIGVSLDIPAGLTRYGSMGTADLAIRFVVEKTYITPIQIDPSRIASEELVNKDIEVDEQIPGTNAGFPEDIPVFPDATLQMEESDMRMYQIGADVEAVKSFYEEELLAGGWKPVDDEFESGGTFIQEWMRDNVEIILTITPVDPATSMLVVACNTCE